jgi:ethanolamine-phosphate cytidylyltransferase
LDQKVIYIAGSFDLLNAGHIEQLRLAKEEGDFLYVGLWDDELLKVLKGK